MATALAFLCLLLPFSYALDEDTATTDTSSDKTDVLIQDIDDLTETNPVAEPDLNEPVPDTVSGAESMSELNAGIASQGAPGDVILVLDNSGSMKKNDPHFLTSQAVTEFISGLDTSTRIAIVIFDQDVTLAMPLTQVSAESRDKVLKSLDRINYRGLFTDSPDAIERAIYELKNNGREMAQKLIIFMTDGIVDTGKAEVDLEKSKWLTESLAPDAADAGIRIFGIAFTEAADFTLIQSLAQTTGGEYYRAIKAEDLHKVFKQINRIISKPVEPEIPPGPVQPPQVQRQAAPPPPPVIIKVPVQPPKAIGKEERVRSVIIIVAVVVLIVTLLAILIVLLRRGRAGRQAGDEYESEAYLNDIHGYTSQASYRLGSKPTMLGRVAGKDSDNLDFIVIPETTIGRRHCLIEYKDFAFWIVDQGSINGTFVNDTLISSETRLKHGDKIRLHKFEFEFVMPEMVDAGMTVVSQTMLGNQAQTPGFSETATTTKEAVEDNGGGFDLDFDLTGGVDSGGGSGTVNEDEEETVIRGNHNNSIPDEPIGSEDETLIPGSEPPPVEEEVPGPQNPASSSEKINSEDETLMPGEYDFPDDEATIRRELPDEDVSPDNFIDLDNLEDDDDK
ncbi:MAG: VWA domain-containing protein [Gammaproteobacteria bacterium]